MATYQSDIRLGDFSIESNLNSDDLHTKCILSYGYGVNANVLGQFELSLNGTTPLDFLTINADRIKGELSLRLRPMEEHDLATIFADLHYGQGENQQHFEGVLCLFEIARKDSPAPPSVAQ
ncbi:MAG: hypothetical protein MK226_20305 [Saprospiraceae bacterium]|nr:hypothetical protein [Saprospiraceae bacterium]